MIWAHVAIRIGHIMTVPFLDEIDAVKCQQRRWHARQRSKDFFEQRLELRETRGLRSCWRSCLRTRITRERSLQNRWSWRDVRQVLQVCVHDNWADQTHDVRSTARLCYGRR